MSALDKSALDNLKEFWSSEYFCYTDGDKKVVFGDYQKWYEWAKRSLTRVIHPEDRVYLKKKGINLKKDAPQLLGYANGMLWGNKLEKKSKKRYPSVPHAYFGNVNNASEVKVVILAINPKYRNANETKPKDTYDNIVRPLDTLLFQQRAEGVFPWAEDRHWVDIEKDNCFIGKDFDWHKRFTSTKFQENWGVPVEAENILQVELFPYPSVNAFEDLDECMQEFKGMNPDNVLPSQELAWEVVKELLEAQEKPIFISALDTFKYVVESCNRLGEGKDLSEAFARSTLIPKNWGRIPSSVKIGYQYMTGEDYLEASKGKIRDYCKRNKEDIHDNALRLVESWIESWKKKR